MKPYYHAYEQRYRRVYEQGVPYWSAFPQELELVHRQIDDFLAFYEFQTSATLLECGCGEGYLASYLAKQGCRYTGVDFSSSAIDKARRRLTAGVDAEFFVEDITRQSCFEDGCFDAVIDVYCLQMLVTDPDRQAYLSQVRRVLGPGGCVFFLEITQEEPFTETVETFDEYQRLFEPDYETSEPRQAYVDGRVETIHLPRVPSRFNSPAGYWEEFGRAGFRMDRVYETEMGCVVFCYSS